MDNHKLEINRESCTPAVPFCVQELSVSCQTNSSDDVRNI